MNAIPHPQTPPAQFSAAEWEARVQLAACYRVFDYLGWTELIYNHISLRLPGTERHFLINPFGLRYAEVTASNLVKIDLEGNILSNSQWPINPAGFTPHATIHANIPNAHCVMHTHTTAGSAVAGLKTGLSNCSFYAAQLHGKVAYHDFEGITVRPDEGPRLLQSIGNKQAVILRNHGLLAWGESIPHAFIVLWTLQRACEIQVATMSMGQAQQIPEEICRRSTEDTEATYQRLGPGTDVFNALVRAVDAIDPSYRT